MSRDAGPPASVQADERTLYVAAASVYTIAFVVLAWPWLSSAVAIPYDGKSQFFPQFAFLARSLAAGESPFWTPNIFAGWPQIADPQSLIFSPVFFAAALADARPSPHLFDIVVFTLVYIGGLGVLLFFRDRGWHAGGALVAALAFAFGGSMASRIQHVGQVESMAFLPLAWVMLARALDRSSWRTGLAAGLFAALTALGRNQVSLLACYGLAGYAVWHWLDGPGRRERMLRSLKPLAACAGVAVVILALPVALTVLLADASNRPEIGYFFAGRGSLHPSALLMSIFPGLFGASDFAREFWGAPSFAWDETFGSTDLFIAQNVGEIYAGALAIAAVGLGLLRSMVWAREIRFFTALLAVSLVYALGKYTPGFHLIYEALPGVKLFRRPADGTFLFGAAFAFVAGYCVHRWMSGTAPAARRWQHVVGPAIAVAVTGVAIALAAYVGKLGDAAPSIFLGLGFLLGAVAVLSWIRRLGAARPVAAIAILGAFCVLDLAVNNAPDESTGLPQAQFDYLRDGTRNETVALIEDRLAAAAAPDRRDRVEIVGVGYHWPNIGLIHNFDHLFGHNPLRLSDFTRATAAADTVAGADQRTFTPLLPSYRSTLEALFGVRVIATGVPIERIDPSLEPGDLEFIARTEDAYIYENPRALPRVMLVNNWRQADFDRLARDGWPDVDPRTTVLLDRPPSRALSGGAVGSARILRYANTSVEIEVDAPAGGILVLNDIWHPWWRARIDGHPVPILKANLLFRGVEVAPGRHIVRFTFHPFRGAWAELTRKLIGPRS